MYEMAHILYVMLQLIFNSLSFDLILQLKKNKHKLLIADSRSKIIFFIFIIMTIF